MPDPTEAVMVATFCSALGIFSIVAVARGLMGGRSRQTEWFQTAGLGSAGDSPYLPPIPDSIPPPLPVGKVRASVYNPFDLLGLGLVFTVFLALVIASVRMTGSVKLDPAALASSIGFQILSAGTVVAMVVTRTRPVEWLGLRWPGWRWIFLIAPCAVLAMWAFFAGLHFSGFMKWVESFGVPVEQDTVKLLQESNDPVVLAMMAGAAVIAAPVCEEIVFRGYLYPAAKRFAGPWVAGICSAMIFSAAHGSVAALLPLFVFGCVLVLIYEMTGSLWAPMAVHCCFNGATVAIQLGYRYLELPIDPTT